MKRKLTFLVSLAMAAMIAFSACTTDTPTPPPVAERDTPVAPEQILEGVDERDAIAEVTGLTGDLNIWSFTNEALVLATAFQKENPDLNINFRMTSMDNNAYQDLVTMALAAGSGDVPDVIFLEVGFVRSFVEEAGWLKDLTHLLPNAVALETLPFTIQAGTSADGVVRAFSYQATPGAMFYRRSMAERYFGTSEPEALQPYFADLDTFMASARLMSAQSGGSTRIVCSPTEVFRAFLPNRSTPWVVNNALNIDPLMLDYMSFAYEMRNEGLDAEVGQWSDHWFSAMRDDLQDAAGNQIDVFSFFMPTWGLPFTILPNSGDTFGDWGIIPGPLPYQWGGTWIGVTEVANNVDAAMEFVRWATLDEQQLTNWATGVYTNDYLAAIDPSVPSDLSQSAGDLVSSSRLIRELANSPLIADSESARFIGGQNPYLVFGEAALGVSFELVQGTDAMIQDHFLDAIDNLYITGQATREETLESFRDVVRMDLPALSW